MKCKVCKKQPHAISEYVDLAGMEGYVSAEEAVRREEGTYNPATDLFYCTSCYIKIGMPLGTA